VSNFNAALKDADLDKENLQDSLTALTRAAEFSGMFDQDAAQEISLRGAQRYSLQTIFREGEKEREFIWNDLFIRKLHLLPAVDREEVPEAAAKTPKESVEIEL
jgi:hypothetical protein